MNVADIPFMNGSYIPNPAQSPFHQSRARIRALLAANRSGKSCGGVNDILMDVTGLHPHRPRAGFPYDMEAEWRYRAERKVMVAWDGAPDYPNVWKPNTLLEYEHWLGSFPHKWYEGDRRLELYCKFTGRDGTVYEWTVHIFAKSYDSGRSKWQSSGVAIIRFDEECPEEIFTEATFRRGRDWDLQMLFTLTPVEGVTWIYDRLYEPWSDGTGPKFVECFHASIYDNAANIPAEALADLEEMYPPGHPERDIRIFGKFRQRSGLVWPHYDETIHIVKNFYPWEIPDLEYNHYRAVDLGIKNPTVCLYAIIDAYDQFYVYDEYVERGLPLDTNARNIVARNALAHPPLITWIDPSAATREMATGTRKIDILANAGLFCTPASNDHMLTFSRVANLLTPNPRTGAPRLRICERCHTLRREMKRYRYKDQSSSMATKQNPSEQGQPVEDDCVDAIRYLTAADMHYQDLAKAAALEEYRGDPVTGY